MESANVTMSRLDSIVKALLHILELLGLVLAIIVVLIVLIGIVRSIWRVTRKEDTLVLPFAGGEPAIPVNRILSEQLSIVEERVRMILEERQKEAANRDGSDSPKAIDVGPLSRPLPEFDAKSANTSKINRFIAEVDTNRPISPVSIGGISFSPESLFAVSNLIRSHVARRTIRGSLDVFGDTSRLAVNVHDAPRLLGKGEASGRQRDAKANENSREARPITVEPVIGQSTRILDLVNDAAFRVVKARLGLTAGTDTWAAYTAFARAYTDHRAFLRSGDTARRDAAIEFYKKAVEADWAYGRAHYNLANLLYDKYSLEANMLAIDHFLVASTSGDKEGRALGYAGLTMAYGQNIQRFRLEPKAEWLIRASSASKNAIRLKDLAETRFAKAWFLQVSERYKEAVDGYKAVLEINDDREETNLEVRSFALNNAGWLYMKRLNDLAKAKESLEEARQLRPNKMIYVNLGELNKLYGNFKAAVDYYERALDLDPLYVNGINELGMVYLAMARAVSEDTEQVRELLSRAYAYHREALAIVSDEDQRNRIHYDFESSRKSSGWSQNDVETWALEAKRLATGESNYRS
jgi:tetratricopeptide (TPR) repeat protein